MIEIFTDIEQGTEVWRQIRCGLPTASMFATVMAKGRGGGDSATRRTYLYKLAGEIITGEPAESYSNGYMERGHALEDAARQTYGFVTDTEPSLVGFIRNGRAGCSPDSLVGDNGMLEIKTKSPHIMIDVILKDNVPPEHKAQVQGQIWISEREWCDVCIYWPRMPLVIKRVHRDEDYIKTLAKAVDDFNEELADIVAKVTAYGTRDAA